MPVVYLTGSLFMGRRAGNNPYNATGLEWQTTSPPPQFNFDQTPVVYFAPYEYSVPDGLRELDRAGGVFVGGKAAKPLDYNTDGPNRTGGHQGELAHGS
jgi:heme/copper-type cytochrome/quinol oxidase subunit 1